MNIEYEDIVEFAKMLLQRGYFTDYPNITLEKVIKKLEEQELKKQKQ